MGSAMGPMAEVRRHADRPTVFVDGEALAPMAWMGILGRFGPECLGRDEYIEARQRIGVRITFLGASVHAEHWPTTVATVERLLGFCPDAYIIFRVEHNVMPQEWIAAHPYELFRFSDGTTEVRHADFMDWASKHPEEGWFDEAEREAFFRRDYHCYWQRNQAIASRSVGSFASTVWRDDVGKGLRSFISKVQASPFAERVIGYFHALGHWEWFYPCASIDYSPAMGSSFREWVEARYEGDLTRLRREWNDAEITFETVQQPSQAEAGTCDTGYFRSPGAKQKVVDYFRCHNEVVADTVIHMAAAIKEATGRSKLAGFCYGYYMSTHYALMGHSALRKVLACPDVDFIESCAPYEGRPAGNDHPLPTVVESFKARNKVFWYEADIRTHLRRDKLPCINYGAPETEAGTIAILTREFAHYLISGIQAYWFDQSADYYDDPRVLALLQRFQQIGALARDLPLGRTADIAYFIDEDSLFPVAQQVSINVLHRQRIQEMGRMGTPYDVWHLEDIARADLPDYRLCVFPNAFSLGAAEREMIREKVCRDNRVILWQYAPGVIDPEARTLDTENMASLTGISFKCLCVREQLELVLTGQPDWMARSLPANFTFGTFRDVITTGDGIDLNGRQEIVPPAVMGDPVFVVDDAEAAIAAHYTWDRLAGMAVKEMDGWTSVYAGALCVPHEILANVAERAGVHRYSDPGDIVYANDRFLAIHTRQGGPRTIRLRERRDVTDALSGKLVARDADCFDVEFESCSTYLYFLGRRSEWPRPLEGPWDAGVRA